jgi:peptidoglycan/LPS O-acetylase OafA/YrhL
VAAVTLEQTSSRLPITDGLRAVAVLAVVLFHFFPSAVPGGYIGVDVFFVISGFVIALRYLPRLTSGEVGIGQFFLRRIQRLVPVYFLVLVAVSIAAYTLLAPMDLKNYGQSLAAQAVYLQNVAFWIQGDYFDKAQYKPLLHTWSLAVEEQFYLFFPLLILVFRRSRTVAVTLLVLAFVASLALGWMIADSSPKTAFYLLPMRAWEFIAGIAVAMVYARTNVGRAATPLFLLGLGLIVFAVAAFNESAPFPGPQALAAVVGAALICLVQRDVGPAVARLLTNPAAQQFGRISYSWYLWHWPLVVFFFAVAERRPNLVEGSAGVLLSYLLALASYRFIERPGLDMPGLRKPGPALTLLGAFLVAALASGLYFTMSQGALNRFAPAERALYAAELDRVPYRCPLIKRLKMRDAAICRLEEGGGEGVLLLGDSHANRAKPLLSEMALAANLPLYLTKKNCKPIDYGVTRNCRETEWRAVAGDIRRYGITKVIVVAYWAPEVTQARYEAGIRRLMATGATVYVQKVAPNAPYFDPVLKAKGEVFPPYAASDYARDYAAQNEAFAKLEAEFAPRLTILDPVPLLCDGVCDFDTGGKPNYSDGNHLNSVGLSRIRSIYAGIFAPEAKGG